MDEERLPTLTYVLSLAAIILVAFALRAARFGQVPPGLYHDEAFNGMDALAVLQGNRPLWFPANNGREPLFIYLVALSVGLMGRTVEALRAPALVLGLLTVPAAAFLGSALFGRRVGLLTAAVTAITLWPVHLSRLGFRVVSLPLFVALALGFLWQGLRHGRRRDYLLAGLFYGASFYTYLASRFTPLPLLLLTGLLLWPAARLPRPSWQGLSLAAVTAAVVAAPLVICLAGQPAGSGLRIAQVSVFSPAISQGDPWGTLARHVWLTAQAFFVRGDRIPRHNLPWRPIFEPGLGLAFLLGVAAAVRRRGAGWLVLVWVGAMLLPTILAEDAPHYLRAVGVLPVLFVLPALGLDAAWRWVAARGAKRACEARANWLGAGLTGLVLLGGLTSTAHDYFQHYAHNQSVYYHFETACRELGNRMNRFLASEPPGGHRVVYVSNALWQHWLALRFLVPESDRVQPIAPASPPLPGSASEALLVLQPGEEYLPALALAPQGTTIEVTCDLYEQGDLEPQPRPFAVLVTATASSDRGQAQAQLERGVRLVEAEAHRLAPERLRVRLLWEASERLPADYVTFAQVLRGSTMLGQNDSPPAGGYVPSTLWRPGDRIVDEREVALQAPFDPASDRLIVGLYERTTMARLRVLSSHTPAVDDAIPVSVQ
ncbi:MAG: glycosyltransferase family 39 protein [Anaerolineae bacterium]|nr:glycosyltransferase family 39 protein [Anaerolineae bacterium]